MDWLSPLSGLVGALVGAGASYLGSRQVLMRQLQDTSTARETAERVAVVASVSAALLNLLEQAERIPQKPGSMGSKFDRDEHDRFRAAEVAWDKQWKPAVRAARVSALEIRDAGLRERLRSGLTYLADWNRLEYAFHGKVRAWVLRGVVDDLVESLYAWRRGERLPEVSEGFSEVAEAWRLRQEELEENAR